MISRKTPKADLENKRSSWRALGFIASLSIILVALSWTSYDVAIRQALNFEADLLEDDPSLINNDPFGEGWIIKVKVDDTSAVKALMDADAYKNSLG